MRGCACAFACACSCGGNGGCVGVAMHGLEKNSKKETYIMRHIILSYRQGLMKREILLYPRHA